MKLETIKYGDKELFFTGITTSFKQKIYQGSILKVSYVDATSKVFERMKERGDKEIYLYIPEEFEYFGFNLVSADNRNYWIPNNTFADISFIRYLIAKDCLEVIGNSANPDDEELFFKIMKYQKREFLESEKETVFKKVISLLEKEINENIGTVKKTEIKDENFIEITYETFFKESDSLERKKFQETVEAVEYIDNPRFDVETPFRSSLYGAKTIICKITPNENMFI